MTDQPFTDDDARRLATILGDALPQHLENARYLVSRGYPRDQLDKLEHAERVQTADRADTTIPKCGNCGRERGIRDAYDYNPLQVVTGQPLGWYSGDDGELCPQCMTDLMRRQ